MRGLIVSAVLIICLAVIVAMTAMMIGLMAGRGSQRKADMDLLLTRFPVFVSGGVFDLMMMGDIG